MAEQKNPPTGGKKETQAISPFQPGKISVPLPGVEISETKNEVKVVTNVMGIDPDKIIVQVYKDRISIGGHAEKKLEEKDKGFYHYERNYGEFRKEFSLPAIVNPDKFSKDVKNGILTIILPKVKEEKKKK